MHEKTSLWRRLSTERSSRGWSRAEGRLPQVSMAVEEGQKGGITRGWRVGWRRKKYEHQQTIYKSSSSTSKSSPASQLPLFSSQNGTLMKYQEKKQWWCFGESETVTKEIPMEQRLHRILSRTRYNYSTSILLVSVDIRLDHHLSSWKWRRWRFKKKQINKSQKMKKNLWHEPLTHDPIIAILHVERHVYYHSSLASK